MRPAGSIRSTASTTPCGGSSTRSAIRRSSISCSAIASSSIPTCASSAGALPRASRQVRISAAARGRTTRSCARSARERSPRTDSSLGNVVMSSRAFKLGECRVGGRNFLGTDVYVPPGARIGENCLLATKVMAPIDGPLRENVGLLGSPAFEIPRAASRDLELLGQDRPCRATPSAQAENAPQSRDDGVAARVALVPRLPSRSMSSPSLRSASARQASSPWRWRPWRSASARSRSSFSSSALRSASAASSPISRPSMIPRSGASSDIGNCPIRPLSGLFPGTPMRNLVSRLLGVRIGRMVFDDGCIVTERTLVEIGDEANLNEASIIQAHSLEEGVYKSDCRAHRARLRDRPRRFCPLRRDDAREDHSRRRFLLDERRDHSAALALARQSG